MSTARQGTKLWSTKTQCGSWSEEKTSGRHGENQTLLSPIEMELKGLKCFPRSPSFYDFVPSMFSDVTYIFPLPGCRNTVYASFTHTVMGVCPINRSLTPKSFLVMLAVAMAPGQLLCKVLSFLSWTRELTACESPVKSLGTPISWHPCTLSHLPRLTE